MSVDDLADELQSMSFGSSDRSRSRSGSGSETISGSGSSSSSSGGPHGGAVDRCPRLGRELSISDLRLVRRLGSGDIGSVYLAELKRGGGGTGAEGGVMAAKVMDKKELKGRNKEGRARTEREILELMDHPFLPRLYGAAENDRWSCLLTEFCPGGDLHVLRQRQPGKRFDEPAVRFYAAEVVAALEYMHMLGIIYRDLKPENVLVRSDGHIMLTDFDLSLKCDGDSTPAQLVSTTHHPLAAGAVPSAFSVASCILPTCIVPAVSCFQPRGAFARCRKKPGRRRAAEIEFVAEPVDVRSMSFVGTYEYLAPEIVSGEGHGSAVDWWTVGIFVFELLYGVTPFRGGDNDMTLANIVARALEFPKEPVVSPAARDLVAGLLDKDPARRVGSTMGATAIKRHPFFGDVNWALLRCTVPPYVPPPPPYGGNDGSGRDGSDESCPGTPVEYY